MQLVGRDVSGRTEDRDLKDLAEVETAGLEFTAAFLAALRSTLQGMRDPAVLDDMRMTYAEAAALSFLYDWLMAEGR